MHSHKLPHHTPWVLSLVALFLSGCSGEDLNPLRIAQVQPVCALNWVNLFDTPDLNSPSQSLRTSTTTGNGFERPVGARSVGLNGLGGVPAVVAFDEAWFRHLQSPLIVQAQVHQAVINGVVSNTEYEWSIRSIDASGVASPVIGRGRPTQRGQTESRDDAAKMLPRLMPVGAFTPQMFACVSALSDNGAVRTTRLVEVIPSVPGASSPRPRVVDIQDLLSGDTRWAPSVSAPLSPATTRPPTPNVRGPGAPVTTGMVECVMTQRDDDVSTRELHLLTVYNGELLHSVASNFGLTTDSNSQTYNRFLSVTPWNNVGQVLGNNPGRVTSAAIVAGAPRAVSIYFMAEQNGRYRLWATNRFANTATFSAPRDVLALNGDTPNGSVYDFRVEANSCPAPLATSWSDANTEQLITLQGGPSPYQILTIRHTPSVQQWRSGVQGTFSPRDSVTSYFGSFADGQARNVRVTDVRVSGRPFGGPTQP